MFHVKHLILYIILIWIFSCAIVKNPDGGEKDLEKPKLLYQYPENNAINFNDKQIILTFNEKIKLNDFNNNIVVSPFYKKKITSILKNKKLILKFDTTFQYNKTYNINLSGIIGDVTENNKIDTLNISFSTSDKIDTVLYNGFIKDKINNENVKNVKIYLVNKLDSININNFKPIYYEKSNEYGYFKFNNLDNKNKKIVAVSDDNKNNKIDFDEKYFISDTLIDSSIIYLNEYCCEKIRIINQKTIDNYIEIQLNNKIKNLIITDSNYKKLNFYHSIINENNIKIFCEKDTIVKVNLLINNIDTLKNLKTKLNYQINNDINIVTKNAISDNDTIKLKLNQPLIFLDTNKILVNTEKDSIPLKKLNFYIENSIIYIIPNKSFNQKNITIYIQKNSIKTLNKQGILDTLIEIKKIKTDELSILKGEINFSLDSNQFYIIQLIQNNKIIKTYKNKDSIFKIENILPGTYKIRYFIDKNNNNKLDMNNLQSIKNEKIKFYKTEIILKENWEINDIILD